MGHLGFVARSDWRYLPRHAQERLDPEAEPEAGPVDLSGPELDQGGRSAGNYYMNAAERGEPAGRWFGPGLEALGYAKGAAVTSKSMETVYGRLQHPGTGEQLGTKPRTYASHEERVAKLLAAEPDASPERRAEITFQARKGQREACHYYDLTFTPEKSWSVLYAGLQQAGMHAEADELWACLVEGYKAGLQHLMDEAAYARTGRHAGRITDRTAGRWEKGTGWVATLWQHHTSRAGDPNLHIHGAVLNRIQLPDGRWYALDGTAIKNTRREAAALISRHAEALAIERLGLHFVARPDAMGREIAGVDARFIEQFSSRRRAISPEAERMAAAYRDRYGREPSAYELRSFHQQAALITRDRKPDHPPTGPEMLASWEQAVVRTFGESLADVVPATGLRPLTVTGEAQTQVQAGTVQVEQFQAERSQGAQSRVGQPRLSQVQGAQSQAQLFVSQVQPAAGTAVLDPVGTLDAQLRGQVIEDALAEVNTKYSVWRRDRLAAAIDAHLPTDTLGLPAAAQTRLIEQLTDQALAVNDAVKLTAAPLMPAPEVWRRVEDGRGFHEPPARYDRYTSQQTLTAEERLIAAAQTHGAAQADSEQVEALLAASSLRPDQRAVVRTVLASGRRVDTLIGPAGAGKSYTLGELARIWQHAIPVEEGQPPPRVLGLAVSENATRILSNAGVDRHLNIDRFLRYREAAQADMPMSNRDRTLAALGPADLIIVDEASMVSRDDARQIVAAAEAAGAKVLFAGDDRQLGAVEAGGVFELLVERTRPARLQEVIRFAEAWQGPASLRLREGDAGAVREYSRRGRTFSGSEDEMAFGAARRFLADHLSGRESLVIATSNEQARHLSSLIRAELVRLGQVEDHGVALREDLVAGVGDLIQTRENARRLSDGNGGWVANRDIYRVEGRTGDGSLLVSRALGRDDVGEYRWGGQVTLPADYVAEHVDLAYVSTVHAAQGRTVDTCYPIITPDMDREALYVAMTRGRDRNLAFVHTMPEPIDGVGRQETEQERSTPEAILAGIIERRPEPQSATQVLAQEIEARESLARLAPEWNDLLTQDAHARYRSILTEVLTEDQVQKLSEDAAEGPLLRAIRHAELSGRDPRQLLGQVVAARELDTAGSIGQVLHHRITAETTDEHLPAVYSYVERTPDLADPELSAYAKAIAQAMDTRITALGEQAAAEPPAWTAALGPVPDEPVQRLEWTRRAGLIAGYREQHGYRHESDAIGPAPHAGAPEARQSWLTAYEALGRPDEQRDIAAAGDGELRNQLHDWAQKEAAGPVNVDAELEETHRVAEFCDTEARYVQAQIQAGRERGEDVSLFEAALSDYQTGAAEAAAKLPSLEEAAASRAEWYEETQAERRAAELARKELDRRSTTELDRMADNPPKPAAEHETTETLQEALERAHEAVLDITQRRTDDHPPTVVEPQDRGIDREV